jgi:hypothetical protein
VAFAVAQFDDDDDGFGLGAAADRKRTGDRPALDGDSEDQSNLPAACASMV